MNFKSNGAGSWIYIRPSVGNTNFVNMMASKGWLTADSNFNYQNRQDYRQRLNITATLTPIRDLPLTLRGIKRLVKCIASCIKILRHCGQNFARLNPYTSGSFSVSYIALKTMFTPVRPNEVTSTDS